MEWIPADNGRIPICIIRTGYQPIKDVYRLADYSTEWIPAAKSRIPRGRSILWYGYPADGGHLSGGVSIRMNILRLLYQPIGQPSNETLALQFNDSAKTLEMNESITESRIPPINDSLGRRINRRFIYITRQKSKGPW